MGFAMKLALLLAVVVACGFATSQATFTPDWNRIMEYNALMRKICHECDNFCPRGPYGRSKEERDDMALQWACYVGCRSSCLLQGGPEKYEFLVAVGMCGEACRAQFPGKDTTFADMCSRSCNAKISTGKPHVTTTSPLETETPQPDLADEQETGLFDPALGEPYPESGGLPHSNYKTLPHHDSQQISANAPLEYFERFIKDPMSDPLVASAIGTLVVIFLLFGIAVYYVLLSKKALNEKGTINAYLDEEQRLTFLHVQLDTEIIKIPPQSDYDEDDDDDFIPPPSPPPKYSEVVQTA